MPLSSVARIEKTLAPLVINHQGSVPGGDHHLQSGAERPDRGRVARRSRGRSPSCICRTRCTPEFAGDAKAYQRSVGAQPLVILAALLAIYIILGVLYESLAHPLTIISTLPSAGLGALLALQLFRAELTVIAFIGIILLIGIVKKNGIMMVDFALAAERAGRARAGAGDPRGVPGALPPDHDDDARRDARRAAADHRDRARARSCAGRSA